MAAPLSARTARTSSLVIGASVEGRPIEAHSLGMGHEVVVVVAGIHGNEPAGTPLATALMRELRRRPELLANRRVLVVPDANPDGRVANTRSNARGVDLNRNFEAPNRRGARREGAHALSEPEAEAIERLVRLHAPHRVLSIHQPLRCVDYDGPAQALAERMAALSRLPVKKLGTRPGSMGAWLGEGLRIPLVTLELPREASKLDERALWDRYGEAVLAFVTGG